MKLGGILGCLLLSACGASSVPAASVTTSNAASMTEASQPASAPAKPETAKATEPPTSGALPSSEPESAPLPKLDFTASNELRANSRAKLEGALKSIKNQKTASGVTAALTESLGKPNWVEDDSEQIWVATDTTQCVRLVLEADGSTNLETMRFTEHKVLSRTTRQNLCTGQIEKDE